MISFKEFLDETNRGLWANIHAKQERIKHGSKEKMRKPGSKGAQHAAALKASQNEEVTEAANAAQQAAIAIANKKAGKKPKNEEVEQQFDMIEEMVEELAALKEVDSDTLWEQLEEFTDEELLEYAIDAKGYKSSTGGLTQKGVNHYRSVTPGSKLKTAVTTPPSKLKPGSKAANRRKSFCARMSGVDGPMKDDKGRPTRKALALRKWNC